MLIRIFIYIHTYIHPYSISKLPVFADRRYKIAESEKVPVDLSSMRRCLAEGRADSGLVPAPEPDGSETHGFLLDFHGISMGFLWDVYRILWDFMSF